MNAHSTAAMDPLEKNSTRPDDPKRTVCPETAPVAEQLAPADLRHPAIQGCSECCADHDGAGSLGKAYDRIRLAFRIASEGGTAQWPPQWRQALKLFESYRVCPARSATAETGTQTQAAADLTMEYPEVLAYARTASLIEISKNPATDIMYNRGFVHGFTNRTTYMPETFTQVPQSPRWGRILRLIEDELIPTNARGKSAKRPSGKQRSNARQKSQKSLKPDELCTESKDKAIK